MLRTVCYSSNTGGVTVFRSSLIFTWLRCAAGNVSGNRCESDCRSRGCEFNPRLVPYFRGDWLWNNFYGHSPPIRWITQEGLLSVTTKVCAWSTSNRLFKHAQEKSVVRWTDRPTMTIADDLGRKATKKKKKKQSDLSLHYLVKTFSSVDMNSYSDFSRFCYGFKI